jgi:hypothetical protein
MSASKIEYVRLEVAKGQTRAHECHARGCSKQVAPAHFMCFKHWKMVPPRLKAAVWEHFMPGQEKSEQVVSQAYLDAANEAIGRVAEQEGK